MSDQKTRKQKAEEYQKKTPGEKIAYNLKSINLELKKINPQFQEFTTPDVDAINLYIKQHQIASDCGQGRDFCIDCGLNEIQLNLDQE